MHDPATLLSPAEARLLTLARLLSRPFLMAELRSLGASRGVRKPAVAAFQLEKLGFLVPVARTRTGETLFQSRSETLRLCDDAAHLDLEAA